MRDEQIEAVAAAIWSAGYAHPSRPGWPEGVQGGSHDLFRKMARAALAAAPAGAAEPVKALIAERDNLASIVATGIDDVAGAALDDAEETIKGLRDQVAALTAAASATGLDIADDNDGKEQDAFEEWASRNRYDMHQHPLHWLFMNERTAAARDGWRAGIRYSRKRALTIDT